jgi:hypothetical protein
VVLRESDPQITFWELLLPEEAKRLPAELNLDPPMRLSVEDW